MFPGRLSPTRLDWRIDTTLIVLMNSATILQSSTMAHKDRSLVLMFMGSGMGAGERHSERVRHEDNMPITRFIPPFLAGASANAVVMEADARKESDVIYRALSSRDHHDMLQTAERSLSFLE
ncbi:hypothetical protein Tco_1161063 [Tanacetum coccineum]